MAELGAQNYGLGPLRRARFNHGLLNLIGESGQVQRQPVERFSLLLVGGEIANQPAFGGVRPEFF